MCLLGDGSHLSSRVEFEARWLLVQLDYSKTCGSLVCRNCVQEGCAEDVLTADFGHSFSEAMGTVVSFLLQR